MTDDVHQHCLEINRCNQRGGRMLSVVDRLEPDLIEVIGAAPSVGRDRWLALAELIENTGTTGTEAQALVNLLAGGDPSDKRFSALLQALSRPTPPAGALEDPDRIRQKTDSLGARRHGSQEDRPPPRPGVLGESARRARGGFPGSGGDAPAPPADT